ncbi:unnamed protein product [Rotaria sordida]|uniref:Uncharacterized protein n=1 Tax=Rotaria sordida TaxID=392033 RepID=A0A815VJ28_9BILA|nr:unnamed protein product [Rotaria sordida]CAF1667651.1 unnamed protein product [Rotaria sordida]
MDDVTENIDLDPPKEVRDLQDELDLCNKEWKKAFEDQQEEIKKLKQKVEQFEKQEKIMNRDILATVGELIDKIMITLEREVGGQKRKITLDQHYEQKQKKKLRLNKFE